MKANEFFTQEWGTGFTKATLSEKNGLLEMSMEDIYSTMERYAELRLSAVVGQSEQLVCDLYDDLGCAISGKDNKNCPNCRYSRKAN